MSPCADLSELARSRARHAPAERPSTSPGDRTPPGAARGSGTGDGPRTPYGAYGRRLRGRTRFAAGASRSNPRSPGSGRGLSGCSARPSSSSLMRSLPRSWKRAISPASVITLCGACSLTGSSCSATRANSPRCRPTFSARSVRTSTSPGVSAAAASRPGVVGQRGARMPSQRRHLLEVDAAAAWRCAARTARAFAGRPPAGSRRSRRRRCSRRRSSARRPRAAPPAARRCRAAARARRSAASTRSRARERGARRAERPCRRSRSRRGSRGPAAASRRDGKNVSTSRIGIDEATQIVRILGRGVGQRGDSLRLERVGRRRRAPAARASSASRQSASHSCTGRMPRRLEPLARAASHSGPGAACTIVSAARVGSCHAACGSTPAAAAPARATRAAASTWACRRSASRGPGAWRVRPRLASQQHVVVRRSRVSGRACPQRTPESRRRPGPASRPRPRGARPAPPRPRSPRRTRSRRARPAECARPCRRPASGAASARAARSTCTHGPPSGRPSQSSASRSSRTGASGSRSGKFRCTTPGRPPRAVWYARQASARWWTAASRPGSWLPTSTNHLANEP